MPEATEAVTITVNLADLEEVLQRASAHAYHWGLDDDSLRRIEAAMAEVKDQS